LKEMSVWKSGLWIKYVGLYRDLLDSLNRQQAIH
jgi:hypothetical protein